MKTSASTRLRIVAAVAIAVGGGAPAIHAPAAPSAGAQRDAAQAAAPTLPDRAPAGLSYVTQSLDQYRTSANSEDDRLTITLVWSKPAQYQQFVDYAVLEQTKSPGAVSYSPARLAGLASRNSLSPAQHGFDVFYADPSNAQAVRAVPHNYIVSGLRPVTDYRFEVRGLTRNRRQVVLGSTYQVAVSTPPATRQFLVTQHGYQGIEGAPSTPDGGASQYTKAIQAAIDDSAAYAARTGAVTEVVIPKGVRLLAGALYLRSNVTLRVDGALTESLDLGLVTPSGTKFTRSNGEKYLPLLNISGAASNRLHDVRVVGTGILDGQGWLYRGDDAPDVEYARQLGLTQSKESSFETVSQNGLVAKEIYDSCVAAGGPAGNSSCYAKRSNLIGGTQVDNMYIGNGLRIQNPANTLIGFSYVSNYVVNGIVAQSFNSNNGDCINVSRFTGFTALNNVVNSGDDNIVMNAGGSSEAPVGSAWVFDNYLARGHGGVAFGSGTSSWVDNVLIEDDVFVGTSNGIRSKSKPGSGGGVRFVTARDLAMKDLTNRVGGKIDPLVVGYQMDGAAFIFTTHYPGAYQGVAWPVYHDYTIENVSVDGTQTAGIVVDGLHDQDKLDALGMPFLPSNHLTFRNVSFRNAGIPRLDYLTDSTFDNVTFRDPHGKPIADPWLNVANLDGVRLDGRELPSANLELTARPQRQAIHTGRRLTIVSNGSFDRFYTETLPDDVRSQVGSILVDGVPLPRSRYPAFQPKADGGGLVPGTDATVLVAPEYGTNVHTVFTFRKSFLDTLAAGRHTFTFVFSDGIASMRVNVEAKIRSVPAAPGQLHKQAQQGGGGDRGDDAGQV
jgi:exo-poly-alpha-galacturonosidase